MFAIVGRVKKNTRNRSFLPWSQTIEQYLNVVWSGKREDVCWKRNQRRLFVDLPTCQKQMEVLAFEGWRIAVSVAMREHVDFDVSDVRRFQGQVGDGGAAAAERVVFGGP